jgi:catechol 2,3-dioxygenase-like lactoylglutathione lyase family enzyme
MMRFVSLLIFLLLLAVVEPAAAQDVAAADPPASQGADAKIAYIYQSCNDLPAMRHFYTDLLGMDEGSYQEGEQGWLVYDCGGLLFMIFPSTYELEQAGGWGMQPGWAGGSVEALSWSVEVPAERFAAVVAALQGEGVEAYFDKPQWFQDSYWGYPVKDPMGNTVEVFRNVSPEDRPETTEWPD